MKKVIPVTIDEIFTIKAKGLRSLLALSTHPLFDKGNLGNSLPDDIRVNHYNDLALSFNDNDSDGSFQASFVGNPTFALLVTLLSILPKEQLGTEFWQKMAKIITCGHQSLKIQALLNPYKLHITHSQSSFFIRNNQLQFQIKDSDEPCKELARQMTTLTVSNLANNEEQDLQHVKEQLQSALRILIYQSPNLRPFAALQPKNYNYFNDQFYRHLQTTNKVSSNVGSTQVFGAHQGYSLVFSYYAQKYQNLHVIKDETSFLPTYFFDHHYPISPHLIPINVPFNDMPILPYLASDFENLIWEKAMDFNIYPPLLFKANVGANVVPNLDLKGNDIQIRAIEGICNKTGTLFDLQQLDIKDRPSVVMVDSTYFGNTTHGASTIQDWQFKLESMIETVIYVGSLGKDTCAWGERPGYLGSTDWNLIEWANTFNNSLNIDRTDAQNTYLANLLSTFQPDEWFLASENAKTIKEIIADGLDDTQPRPWIKISDHGGAFGSLILNANGESVLLRFNLIPRNDLNQIRRYNENERQFIQLIISMILQS